MYGYFRGMMQVIADFFQKEVIIFVRPYNSTAFNSGVYTKEVYGQRANGLTNGQIMLVTDWNKYHFQLVTHLGGVRVDYWTGGGPNFNTADVTSTDRYGWMRPLNWMPNAPLLPAGWAPLPLVPRPCHDARWLLNFQSDEWRCFEGRTTAVSIDGRYGHGQYPFLPIANNLWQAEEGAPPPAMAVAAALAAVGAVLAAQAGVPMVPAGLVPAVPYALAAFPYPFSPHLIVSGVYPAPAPAPAGTEYGPRWTHTKSLEHHEWPGEAERLGIPTNPLEGSAP